MTDETIDPWDVLEGVLEDCWPGEWTETTGDSYRLMLAGYEPSAIVDALRAIARRQARAMRGKPMWRPSVGDIIAAIDHDANEIGWTEVEEWFVGRRGVLRHPWAREELIAAAKTASEVLASFVTVVNLDRLRQTDYDDPVWGQKNRADLKREWEEFAERMAERTARGLELPSGDRVVGTLAPGGPAGGSLGAAAIMGAIGPGR